MKKKSPSRDDSVQGVWRSRVCCRTLATTRLKPPYQAIRVTGALFHTQGGLVIDEKAHVMDKKGRPIPNLFAGGGAACGLSGDHVWGYLSGNGLLSAVVLGRIAGTSAAA